MPPNVSDSPCQSDLGLAIVKRMVQRMGGTLAIDSREGARTTVTLVVPPPPDG